MSERRMVIRTDDGAEIEVRWSETVKKLVVEFEERPAQSGIPAPAEIPPRRSDIPALKP